MTAATTGLEGLPAAVDACRDLEPGRDGVLPNPCEMIRSWRCRLGVTQEELARALGVTLSTLNRWENGRVLPSQLAWRELKGLAAKRGCPLFTF